MGGTATLSVGVSGTGPFSYTWYFNGAPVGIDGNITTVAGGGDGDGGAATNVGMGPFAVALDTSGNLFIADYFNNRIRKVGTNGIITTVAGNGYDGYSGDGGAATNAALYGPDAVAVDAAGDLFISDTYNERIRKVTASNLTLASGGAGLVLSNLTAGNAGNYYVEVSSAYGSATSLVARLAFEPWFTGITLNNGTVSMSFKGAASSNYVFSYATNLAPPVTWTPLTTNRTDSNGDVTMIDTNTTGVSSRFYRASAP